MYCEWEAYMGRSTPVGTREGGCMYCELGGDVCGEIGRLGHEKEVVCIVSWEGEYVRRSGRLGHENDTVCMGCMWGDCGWVAENKGVCIVSGMRIWGDRRRVGSGE